MSFTLDLSRACEQMKGRNELIARKVLLDLNASLTIKTPVGDGDLWQSPPPAGYVGGRARGNWQHGFGAVTAGDLPDIDPSGRSSIDRVNASVATSPAAGIHYLFNNLPYMQRLEDGWSKQAPAGMMELTIIEFGGIVKRSQA